MNFKKKGIYFSLEALFAAILLLSSAIIISKTYFHSSPRNIDDKISQDFANILFDTKLRDINNTLIIEEIKKNSLDTDNSILKIIGKLWIQGNKTLARELAENLTDLLPKNKQISIVIKSNDSQEIIYNTSTFENYTQLITNRRLISGIELYKPLEGTTSRALLVSMSNKTNSKFAYFGGFVGQGNVTRFIKLNNYLKILELNFQGDIGTEFKIEINNQSCNTSKYPEGIFYPIEENETISNYNLSDCIKYLKNNSKNYFKFDFKENINNSFIGGGFVEVKYKDNSEFDIPDNTYWFPEIEGIINLYSSIISPKNISNSEIYLHYKTNYNLVLILGNITLFNSSTFNFTKYYSDNNINTSLLNNSEYEIYLDNNYIINELSKSNSSYKKIEDKTIPLRIMTTNFTNRGNIKKKGNGDCVLITDVSGSMDWRFDSDYTGTERTCEDPDLEDSSTKRISVAKCINKDFIEQMLRNIDGNRIGLVSYSTDLDNSENLTTNISLLDQDINNYVASGATCIACGIINAINFLKNTSFIINSSQEWKYYDGPSNESFNNSWHNINFNDNNWSIINTPAGYNYTNINYNISNQKYVYFRKSFFKENSTSFSPEIFLASDDNARVFVNNNLVIDENLLPYTEHDAKYWNINEKLSKYIFFDGFEQGFNWTTDSNDDGGVIELDQDPYAGEYNIKMYGDNYAYNDLWFEKNFNLSNTKNPFLEFYVSFEDTEYTDELFVDIYDGSWHRVYSGYDNNGHNNYYDSSIDDYKKVNIDLSNFDLNNNITIRFSSEVVHTERWDNIQIDNIAIKDYDVLINGTNVVAVQLKNNDDNAYFDLQLTEQNIDRKRAILVMSDGEANYCYSDTGSWDCSDDEAKQQAIDFACEAKRDYNIDIYSVAFGANADFDTLQKIADCDNSSNFFNSTNVTGLKKIYKIIADEMLKEMIIAETQNYEIIGEYNISKLFKDSYFKINSSNYKENQTGISITFRKKIDKNNPVVHVPKNCKVIDAKVTSYSSKYWTSKVVFNNEIVYNIDDYTGLNNSTNTNNTNNTSNTSNVSSINNTIYSNYVNMGDPFIVKIPPELFKENNYINITSSDISHNTTYISNNNSLIYTVLINTTTDYTEVLSQFEGCNWNVEFEDNTFDNIKVPASYNGNKSCSYTEQNISYNINDAYDVAMFNLLDNLDFDDNGKVLINFNENDFEIKIIETPEVPYMWGPSIIEVNLWS